MIRKYLMAVTLLVVLLVGGNSLHAASALSGTWAGSTQSLSSFDSPYFRFTGSDHGLPSDVILFITPPVNSTIEMNLSNGTRLVTAETRSVTLNVTVKGKSITGTVVYSNGAHGTINGAVVTANKFFLLHISVDEIFDGACGTGEYQGTASISPSDPNKLLFTGSGLDKDCVHTTISGQFTKQ